MSEVYESRPAYLDKPCCHISIYVICFSIRSMKTTLNIDDTVFTRLKTEAASSGRTMSELVESALRLLLTRGAGAKELPSLPSFDGGGTTVDIADREHLWRAKEGR